MSIDELLRNTNGISVTVSLDDLRQLFSEIARNTAPITALEESPRTLTRKETLQIYAFRRQETLSGGRCRKYQNREK